MEISLGRANENILAMIRRAVVDEKLKDVATCMADDGWILLHRTNDCENTINQKWRRGRMALCHQSCRQLCVCVMCVQ